LNRRSGAFLDTIYIYMFMLIVHYNLLLLVNKMIDRVEEKKL
jgi:hypothetical protein